ncbi:cholesterol 7-desaturase-like [Temnothorax curvispinosus]|uniref:cholesterol 7-desaturase n=1 Tax=Temnothorax curvispinosus TaxID=300111 RepID=A0A6J1QTA1_9HYME|nr:cholesterol 7-desaturase-like [Temnothorax curvispinosus]XP_024883816.1 cholesterol 7-desaturase-like [Temnothorax curvispinosus]XP_024883817.1 cholesterol 7-desaturase-like [Temnothorax curvispinosus]XP_024883818.1 cholesterol 7-desaturase-like [Temnothorax curvispinosus]XP_024893191.1 cholesterol 7-desaturase-like [Temnothorax curvispinosus]
MLELVIWITVIWSLVLLIYFAYFFKFNWVKDLRSESKTRQTGSVYTASKNRKVGKLPPVYPNGWFALLESSEIKRGQVKHVSALGENFAVFRTERGVVNILDAYCPHLGANMAEGGRVKGDCLECPFHSWKFRGEDGYCESIPYTEKVPHIARAKVWKSCEVNHHIFVWYHSESVEPDWQPQPHTFISNGTWRYQGRNEFLINCHIQDIAENGADPAHLDAVHGPGIFLSGNLSWLARHLWITNRGWQPHCSYDNQTDEDANADAETAKMRVNLNGASIHRIESGNGDRHLAVAENGFGRREKHKAGLHMCHKLILLERFNVMEINVVIEQIGPSYVELMIDTSFGPMCILQTVTPIEPLLQRVTHQIFSPPLLAPYANLVFLGECVMFQRDIMIWNYKKYERQPILVREDRAILAYRRWYSQFYSDHSPTYQTAMKDLEW